MELSGKDLNKLPAEGSLLKRLDLSSASIPPCTLSPLRCARMSCSAGQCQIGRLST